MASIPSITGLVNQLADLGGLNNWQLNECSYNGAQFHWMQPSYNGLDPVSALEEYIQQMATAGSSQKPNYGTWSNIFSMQDSISQKLCTFPIPNLNGYYLDTFGFTGTEINLTGLVYGISYLQVLDNLSMLFLDVAESSATSSASSAQGVLSGSNFRVLNHVIYGPIYNVWLKDYKILTKSDRFQAATFELTLIASDPSYLSNPPPSTGWQVQLQAYLAEAEAAILGINQTFSLGQQFGNNIFDISEISATDSINQIPVINGTGQYLQSVILELQNAILQVSNSFKNAMAFLAQNTGGLISNPAWNAITVDYSVIPLYLTPGQAFSQSDAQVVITYYNGIVNNFISYANDHVYTINIQNNIFQMQQSLVTMNNFCQTALTQNAPILTVNISKSTDLYTLMFNEKQSFNQFEQVAATNNGAWFSCLTIPIGTVVNL